MKAPNQMELVSTVERKVSRPVSSIEEEIKSNISKMENVGLTIQQAPILSAAKTMQKIQNPLSIINSIGI